MLTNTGWKPLIIMLWICTWCQVCAAQKDTLSFWEIPDTLHKGRFRTATITGLVVYTGTVISLSELWYKESERESFHTFNDWGEWQQMDKAGHMFTAYFESDWAYHVARWTGMERKSSIWTGALVATGLQTTIEILDGFSSDWGFSWYDMAFNVAGAGLWASQQVGWNEQRIRLKMSTTYQTYPEETIYGDPSGSITLQERANDLYGENIFQSFLKDYNAQTIWMSVNVHSFLHEENRFPHWLNIAAGYSAENMYGGFENSWIENGNTYEVSPQAYPRYRQFYLSPDVDLSKIKVKSKFLKTLLCMANIFKFPAPALEINGVGEVRWKWIHY